MIAGAREGRKEARPEAGGREGDMFDKVYSAVIVFLFGLVIGSFDNVAIYRIPEGKSVVAPRSFCPHCGTQIAWYDNIPVLSYLLLRARCRHCGERISLRYPLVELSSGLLFLAVYAKCGFTWDPELLLYLFMVTVLIIVAAIDLRKQIIPNKIIYPAVIVGLAAVGVIALARGDLRYFTDRLIGFAAISVPWGIAAAAYPKGFGMGDAKLAAFTGTVLGWRCELVAFFAGILLGALVGAALMASRKRGRKSRIPFGPFLAAGALVALFWGQRLWDLYVGLL